MSQKSYTDGHGSSGFHGPQYNGSGADKASEYESTRHTWWWELG